MNAQRQIKEYIAGQPEPKRSDMQELHRIILEVMPACKLWFLDGKNSEGKIVANPNIGYGIRTMEYADGKNREFYQIGLSANTTGISVYILGIDDKTYLAKTYGKKLGKASVTGYCIKFKTLKDINIEILEAAIRYGFTAQKKNDYDEEDTLCVTRVGGLWCRLSGLPPHGARDAGLSRVHSARDRRQWRCTHRGPEDGRRAQTASIDEPHALC